MMSKLVPHTSHSKTNGPLAGSLSLSEREPGNKVMVGGEYEGCPSPVPRQRGRRESFLSSHAAWERG